MVQDFFEQSFAQKNLYQVVQFLLFLSISVSSPVYEKFVLVFMNFTIEFSFTNSPTGAVGAARTVHRCTTLKFRYKVSLNSFQLYLIFEFTGYPTLNGLARTLQKYRFYEIFKLIMLPDITGYKQICFNLYGNTNQIFDLTVKFGQIFKSKLPIVFILDGN